MEQVGHLPPPLKQIEIPQQLNVTRLATSGPCLLRAIAPRSDLPKTLSGPRAEFGNVVHSLTELAATGRLGVNGIPGDPHETFEYLLAEAASRLASRDETRPYANLSVGFTRREWEKRRFLAIAGATELVRRQRTGPRFEPSFPRVEPLSLAGILQRNVPTSAEVPFESTALRIRGRIDLVVLESPDRVIITDFKSGSVVNPGGLPNEQTCLQMRLYGLVVRAMAPKKQVVLRVVSRDGESLIPCDDESNEATSEWLRVRTAQLTAGEQLEAQDLAVVGDQCKHCDVRPVCPLYRSSVGALWKRTDDSIELPLDIAGTVLACETDKEGYLSTKLRDLADRVVKVHRLNPRNDFESVSISGHVIWFFDLASIEAKRPKPGWRHPRNFHEVASMATERTAWTLRLFLD